MSRTKHVTRDQWTGRRPLPSLTQPRTQLTKPPGGFSPIGNVDRPLNSGPYTGGKWGGDAGQRRREEHRIDKLLGRRRDRRRRNREPLE